MMDSPQVAVVVLNHNGAADTAACLRSLERSTWPGLRKIVVDNASNEPVEPLLEAFTNASLVLNHTNLGFAGGMNVGVSRALDSGADYVLLLNNDTVADPSMVEELVRAAQGHSDAGIISPLVLCQDMPEIVMSAGYRFDPRRGHHGRPVLAGQPLDEHLHGVEPVAASSGEAMFVSAATAHEVGPLDESLYLRLEDIDWAMRMKASGRRNYIAFAARLWHKGSASSGGAHSPLNAYYHTRNILTVCARYAPKGRLHEVIREAEILGANVVHARRGAHPLANAMAVLRGWRDYHRGVSGPR